MRPLAALLLVLACALGTARLRAEEAVTLDVPVFSGGFDIAFHQETARLFERERPGVRVNLYGDPRIADRVSVRVLSGDPPDLTDAPLPWARLIAAGAVLDLTPHLDGPNWEGDARWRDTFLPGALDRWTVDGRVYGVPFAHAVWAFYHDRALFRRLGIEPPRTWDEFFDVCARLRAAGVAPVAFPGQVARYGDPLWRHAYRNLAGPEAFARFLRMEAGTWEDPRLARATALVQRLARETFAPGWEGASHTGAQLALLEGRAAMTISASWIANEMRRRIPEGFELGAFNLPVFADGVTDPSDLQVGSTYSFVPAGSPRAAEAVAFLRFLTSRERALAFTRRTDSPTAVRGAGPGDFSPLLADVGRLLAQARGTFDNPPPTVGALSALAGDLAAAREDLLLGRVTPEAFGATLERAAERERARLRNPDTVRADHPLKAALLAACLLALAAFLAVRLRSGRTPPADDGSLGPLRPRMLLLFVGPALAVYALFAIAPALAALAGGFWRWDGVAEPVWQGTTGFRRLLLESDTFWSALGNNLFLMVVPALLVVPVSLGLAVLLAGRVPGGGFVRAVVLFPNLLGPVAAALLWMLAYEADGGWVNSLLAGAGRALEQVGFAAEGAWLRGWETHPWLAPANLYLALLPIYLWSACGFNVLLYLAALEGIDRSLYEAAVIDGAGPWSRFVHITLPLLRDTLAVSCVLLVVGGLAAFELVWVLTAQDPSVRTHTLATWMVTSLFREFDAGRAAALAGVTFVLVLALGGAVHALVRRREAVDA